MKKKLLCWLCVVAMCMGLLAGCGDDYEDDYDDEEEETTTSQSAKTSGTSKTSSTSNGDGNTWTILLYLCGTDLESDGGAGTENLYEILDAEASDDINFVIETGGCSEWEMEDIDADVLSRYIKNGDELELVETEDLARMSDVETYSDFLTWGTENYPADKYMLIVWDHGMGSVDGVVYDELFDEDDPSLTVKEIAQGIADTGETFELVGFDACLMSTLEQAAALCPYARYMVASEETEPGAGWDYTTWLNYLVDNPGATGAELGTEIVDTFYDKCAQDGEEADCTLAVTDLSKIPTLVEDYNAMTAQMKGFTDDTQSIKVITGAFKSAENYGGNNEAEDYTDMVDLGDFILNAQGVLSDTGEKVIDDLLDAVVYHKNGEAKSKGEGLSVYVPLSQDEDRYDTYASNAAISGDYLRFLEALYGFDTPDNVEIVTPVAAASTGDVSTETKSADDYTPGTDMSKDKQTIKFTTKVNDDGYMEVDVTSGSDIIDAARCNLYWYNEDEGQYYYFGSDYTVNVNDDWTEFEDGFDDAWVCANGCPCMLIVKDMTDDYITYAVPVTVNGTDTNLQLMYSYDTDDFTILGLWDGVSENGIPSRNLRQLKDGDQVDFRFQVKSNLKDKGKEVTVEGFTVDGDITVEDAELWDGTYAYSMVFEDIFGGETETPWATMTVENGEITCELS